MMDKRFKVIDREGYMSVADIRVLFEQGAHGTAVIGDGMVLDWDGAGYADHDTDLVWVGFAFGLRAAEQRGKDILVQFQEKG